MEESVRKNIPWAEFPREEFFGEESSEDNFFFLRDTLIRKGINRGELFYVDYCTIHVLVT